MYKVTLLLEDSSFHYFILKHVHCMICAKQLSFDLAFQSGLPIVEILDVEETNEFLVHNDMSYHNFN